MSNSTRRDFVTKVGQLATAASLVGALAPDDALAEPPAQTSADDWDLSWLDRLATATDRAVFDWPSLGDPADATVLQIAERYLDNCKAAYGSRRYDARVVLNIRTQAVPAALSDETWQRFSLGAEYNVKDPNTKEPATRNPFWHRAPEPVPGIVLPTLADLVQRGAIILVCDFALGHMSKRLAGKTNRDAADIHRELRAGFVQSAYGVPSGIFGLAKSQNAGCAFVRM